MALQPLTLYSLVSTSNRPPHSSPAVFRPVSLRVAAQARSGPTKTPRQSHRGPAHHLRAHQLRAQAPSAAHTKCSARSPPAAATSLQRPLTLASAMQATSNNSQAMPDQQDGSQDAQTCFLDVVDLVLQHSDLLRRIRDFCRLLQTHTAVATAAARHCRGRLEVALFSQKQAAAAAPWLARHGQGVASLSVACMPDGHILAAVARATAAGQALAQALRQAAAQQPGSAAAQSAAGLQHLRSLHLSVPPAVAADVLPLAGRQLSRLDLSLSERPDEAAMARVAAAVAALPGLQRLWVGGRNPWFSTDDIVSALSSSRSLTRLDGGFLQDASVLQCVPSQLQSLTVGWLGRISTAAGLQLQHCTALSKLAFSGFVSMPLVSGDLLHVSLQELELQRPTTLQPLAALTRLRTLSIRDPPAAVELRRLTCLTNLTHISLDYSEARPAASSAAWPLLPGLRQLSLFFMPPYSEDVSSMAHLAQATNLTKLALCFCSQDDDEGEDAGGAVAALAAALPALTNLQAVDVKRSDFMGNLGGDAAPHPDLVAGWPSLLAAITGLPRLNPDARAECEQFDQELKAELCRREAE